MAKLQFSRAFWVANTVELFERAVYYGVSVVITLYLSRILGFDDIQAAAIAGVFSACLYLLPFVLLTCGYLALALIIYGQVGRRSGSQWPKIGIADTSKQFDGSKIGIADTSKQFDGPKIGIADTSKQFDGPR